MLHMREKTTHHRVRTHSLMGKSKTGCNVTKLTTKEKILKMEVRM